MSKRIVVEYRQGRFKGLWQIFGTTDQMVQKESDMPPFLPQVQFLDHLGDIALVTVRRRYFHYREQILPESYGSMNPAQV